LLGIHQREGLGRRSGTGRAAPGWRLSLLLFGLALAPRLLVFGMNTRPREVRFKEPDSGSYIQAAESLRNRFGLLDPKGRVTWPRLPGYPLLLAACFEAGLASPERLAGAVLIQIVLGSLAVVLSSRAAFWVDSKAATPVGILMALEPSSIAYSNVVLSETLYTLGLLAVFCAWRRWLALPEKRSLFLLATLVGLLPLVRPIALYLPFLMFVLLLGLRPPQRGRWWMSLLFLVVSLVPATVLRARNYYYFGSARFDTSGPWAKAIFARSVRELRGERVVSSPATQPWEYAFGEDQGLSATEAMEIQDRYFYQTISAHPVTALERIVLNGFLMMGVPDAELSSLVLKRVPPFTGGKVTARLRWLASLGPLSGLLILGMLISLGGLATLPLLVNYARSGNRVEKGLMACLGALVLYHLVLSSFVGHQGERYRLPMIPLLAISLVAGSSIVWGKGEKGPVPDARKEPATSP